MNDYPKNITVSSTLDFHKLLGVSFPFIAAVVERDALELDESITECISEAPITYWSYLGALPNNILTTKVDNVSVVTLVEKLIAEYQCEDVKDAIVLGMLETHVFKYPEDDRLRTHFATIFEQPNLLIE